MAGVAGLAGATILTAEACDSIRDLHNRMPVMMGRDTIDGWLGVGDPVVVPGIDEAVSVKPVSPKMNGSRYNEPDCVEALIGG